MFGPAALILLGILLIVSVLARQTPLFLFSLVLLLSAGLSRIWRRYCLTGLEYHRRLSRHQVEWGGTVELELEVINRKLLPLPWLEIEEDIPRVLPPSHSEPYSSSPGRSKLRSLVPLRPYERVRRRYLIPCMTRGEHVFGPARLCTGDLFGAFSQSMHLQGTDVLIVYPRVVPLTDLGMPTHQPLGDLRTKSWIFEDPARFVGLREYRPEDGTRRIHWAATVRAQHLQVKVYEPTTTGKLLICLNLNSELAPSTGYYQDADVMELTITTAASIAAWAIERGYEVGVVTNGVIRSGQIRGSGLNIGVGLGSGRAQLPRILEALACLEPYAVSNFSTRLLRGAKNLPFGSTVVAVSSVLWSEDAATLTAMSRRGLPVTLVLTDPHNTAGRLDGVVVRRVGAVAGTLV